MVSLCRLWLSRAVFQELAALSLCGRQSPCQYSGRHHLPGLAWGPKQSPLWLRLDFVVDQWDLQGQTDTVYFHVCCRKTQFGLRSSSSFLHLLES